MEMFSRTCEMNNQRDMDALKNELLEAHENEKNNLSEAHSQQCYHEKNELDVIKEQHCEAETIELANELHERQKEVLI